MVEKGIPRHDYPIVDASGKVIGKVTSGTQSPTLQKAIGMGYVETAFAEPGTTIFIDVRNKPVQAVVVKIPFLQ
jgi:aminomethyltransferase